MWDRTEWELGPLNEPSKGQAQFTPDSIVLILFLLPSSEAVKIAISA